jgi:hypothetical protein
MAEKHGEQGFDSTKGSCIDAHSRRIKLHGAMEEGGFDVTIRCTRGRAAD